MKRTTAVLQVLTVALLLPGARAHGADATLQGPAAVLRRAAGDDGTPKNSKASSAARLAAEVRSFSSQARTLDPKAAAAGWLSLADRVAGLKASDLALMEPEDRSERKALSGRGLIAALPPPAAWDDLIEAIRTRPAPEGENAPRELGLRLLADVLANRPGDQLRDLTQLQAVVAALPRDEAGMLVQILERIQRAFLELHGDARATLSAFERDLERLEPAASTEGPSRFLSVPDLVALTGAERAESLLRRVLKLERVAVDFQNSDTGKTETLARKLALDMMAELKQPCWSLCESVDAVALYEAFEARFPTPEPRTARATTPGTATNAPANPADPAALKAQLDALRAAVEESDEDSEFAERFGPHVSARSYYLMGLILSGRLDDATALARRFGNQAGMADLPASAIAALDRAGRIGELDAFLFQLLSADSRLPFWKTYLEVAARAGTTDRMLALARTASAQPDLRPAERQEFRRRLASALLAADRVEEAVLELRELIRTDSESGGPSLPGRLRRMSPRDLDEPDERAADPAWMLATLGAVLGQTTWLDEGLKALRQRLSEMPTGSAGSGSEELTASVVDLLLDAGRLAEAEEVVASQLARIPPRRGIEIYRSQDASQDLLIALCRVYHQAGRPADVLAVLEQAPQWGAKDLADLRSKLVEEPSLGHRKNRRSSGDSIGYFAAAALAKMNRQEEALTLVNALLDRVPDYDPAFELLLDIGGPAAAARLDALASADPFEERPRIWKAESLRRTGQWEAAERAAREAVRVDPSDGEQGTGRRMRAYGVLAAIREAQGDAREAEFFRGVVRAIRKSEEADRLHEAGLLRRAVALYQESLTDFADAYCIQSRLAVQLSDLGLHDEAAKHYQRAFELMPDSFGRVESHCFGCERAFGSGTAQGVAERVFTKLAEKTPDKPQVHYLLGYLRSEQGRHREALEHYRRAVQLDPDYLNAWRHLADAARKSNAPVAERDAAILSALRLDPHQRHGSDNLESVTDLRGLWTLWEKASGSRPSPPTELLPLTASAGTMSRQLSASEERLLRNLAEMRGSADKPITPGEMVARQRLMGGIALLIAGEGRGFGEY